MPMKVYEYPKCSTCVKAKKYLTQKKVKFNLVHIVDSPPSKTELKRMLKSLGGERKKLLNTSGQLYREMNLKDKLPKMSDSQLIDLLAKNGKLIKRPFVLSSKGDRTGFKENEWKALV